MSSAVTSSADSGFDSRLPATPAQITTNCLNNVIQIIANNCILENPFLSLPKDPTVFLHRYLAKNDHDFLIQESHLEKMCKDFNLFFNPETYGVLERHLNDPQIQGRVFTRFASDEVEIVEHAIFLDPNRAFSKKTISNIHALAMEALLTQIEENASLIRLDSSYTEEERKQILDIITTLASCHPGQRLLLLLLQNNKPIHFKKGDAWLHIPGKDLDTVVTNPEPLQNSVFLSRDGKGIDDLEHHVSGLAHELIHALQKTNAEFPWEKSVEKALSCSCCTPETNNRLKQTLLLFKNIQELCTILPVVNLLCENFFLRWFDQPQRAGHTFLRQPIGLLLKQALKNLNTPPQSCQTIETELLQYIYERCVDWGLHQDSLTLSLYLAQTENKELLGSLLKTPVWQELLKLQPSDYLIQRVNALLSNLKFRRYFIFCDIDVKKKMLYAIANSHFLPHLSSSAATLCLSGTFTLGDLPLYTIFKNKNLFSKLEKKEILLLLDSIIDNEEDIAINQRMNVEKMLLEFCLDLLAAWRQRTTKKELDPPLFLNILKNAFHWMEEFPDEALSLIKALQEKLETQPSFLNKAITTLFTNKSSPPKPYFALADLITKNGACQNFLQRNVATKNVLKEFASLHGRQDLVQAIDAIKSHREKRTFTNCLPSSTQTDPTAQTQGRRKQLKKE